MTATTRHLIGDALMLAGLATLVVGVPLIGLGAGMHAAFTAGVVALALGLAGGGMQR